MMFAIPTTQKPLGFYECNVSLGKMTYLIRGKIMKANNGTLILTEVYITDNKNRMCYPVLSGRPIRVSGTMAQHSHHAPTMLISMSNPYGHDDALVREITDRVAGYSRPADERGLPEISKWFQTTRSCLDHFEETRKYLPATALGSVLMYLNSVTVPYSAIVRNGETYYVVSIEDGEIAMRTIAANGNNYTRYVKPVELIRFMHGRSFVATNYNGGANDKDIVEPDTIHCAAYIDTHRGHWNWCDSPHTPTIVLK